MSRLITTTQRISTKFGTHYCHVSRDASGAIREVSLSSPGKFDNSELSEFVIQIQDAINEVIGESP